MFLRALLIACALALASCSSTPSNKPPPVEFVR